MARTDVSAKTKDQYVWAAGHIKAVLGGIRLDQLDRQAAGGVTDRDLWAGGEVAGRAT